MITTAGMRSRLAGLFTYRQLLDRWLPIGLMLVISIWLNWHFLKASIEHGTIMLEAGEYNYDRLINMGFAKAAQEWGINFYEPFNRIEPVFYQFLGWWGLGFAARMTGLQPWAVANLIHIFYVPVFFLVAWRLFGVVTRSRDAVLAGLGILFLFGNLEWFLNHEYSKIYGAHAILLPFLQQSFAFYMDSYSVLFGYVALIAWLNYLLADTPGWKQILVFWLPAALAFNLHFLPAIFFILLFMSLLFGITFSELDTACRRRVCLLLAGMFPLYMGMLWYWSFRPPMQVFCILGGGVWLVFLLHDRKKVRYLIALAPLLPLVILAGANLLSFQSYYGSFANDYNESVRQIALGIPAHVLLLCYFPVVALAVVSISREADSRWFMIKGIIVLVAVAVIFNDKLGYNNHPYRYVPYTYPVWAMLAGDGLTKLLHSRRLLFSKIILCVTIVPLALGVWSNISHHRTYATASNCKPVDPLVMALVDSIEKVRSTFPEAVFYVEPTLIAAGYLAPYTGAKFFFSSNINFRSAYKFYWLYEEMLLAAREAGIRVDFVILPRQISGKAPLSEMVVGDRQFMIYHVVNYSVVERW